MRTLWEQGFFGKGNYSRSEPSWMRRKEARKGTLEGDGYVAENATLKRRADREQTKWERSRAQIEALEQILQEEGNTGNKRQVNLPPTPEPKPKANGQPNGLPNGLPNGRVRDTPLPPVGPLQLLALPNSTAELVNGITVKDSSTPLQVLHPIEMSASTDPLVPVTPPNGTALPEPILELEKAETANGSAPGLGPHGKQGNESAARDQQISAVPMKRRKSVRFSPKVESTTFIHSDPPSPYHSAVNLSKISGLCVTNETPQTNGSILVGSAQRTPTTRVEEIQIDVGNKEHLQLSAEEAFFLTFAIGALKVLRPDSGEHFTTQELFELLRRHSYFPPRISPSPDPLSPDDPFLVQYAVYHHFRSLGWVVRGGIKFGVDWLIYNGGPVFDHAAFGLVVIPEYSDPWWKEHGEAVPQREPWSWLHCHSRKSRPLCLISWLTITGVLARVYKHLVLVYVDIPPPATISSEQGVGQKR